MSDHCEHMQDVAAWTLSALDAVEAERFVEHLAGCSICQAEVDELTPAAEVLAMAAPQIAAPEALRERIMQTVRAEAQLLRATGPQADRPPDKRAWWHFDSVRPAIIGAVACALLAAGVVAGVVIDRSSESSSTKTFQAQEAYEDMTAVATVSADHVTLHLDNMVSPPKGRVYQVWLQRDGEVIPTSALFMPSGQGRTMTIMVDEPLDGADRVMISDEPMGGSQAPTGEVYVDARLS